MPESFLVRKHVMKYLILQTKSRQLRCGCITVKIRVMDLQQLKVLRAKAVTHTPTAMPLVVSVSQPKPCWHELETQEAWLSQRKETSHSGFLGTSLIRSSVSALTAFPPCDLLVLALVNGSVVLQDQTLERFVDVWHQITKTKWIRFGH